MRPRGAYTLTTFKNPNRSTAYRVTGTKLDGVRVRENFKTQPEALARKQQLEIERLNSAPEKRVTPPTASTYNAASRQTFEKWLLCWEVELKFLKDMLDHSLRSRR
jgi:hypothetical protein